MTRRLLLALFLSILSLPAFADAYLQLLTQLPDQGHLDPYIVNSDFSFSVSVYNFGPDVARNVRVTFNVPPGLPIRTLPQNCDVTHLPVVCTVGDMAVTQPHQNALGFNLTFTLPSKSTSLTFGATVSSDTPNPDPFFTSLSRTIDVVDAAWLVVHNVVSPQRADPGTTTVAKTDVVNFLPTFPQDLHLHYEATGQTIESIDAPARWTCSINGGATADCVAQSLDNNCRCSGTINVTLRLKNDRAGGTATLKTSASSSLVPYTPLPSEATSSTEIYRWIVVSSTADAGDRSLRAAIDEANRGCSAPCKIAFEIPAPVPEAGWFTIVPSTPLPPITAPRVFVDAKTQSAFTGDTNPAGPEIAIDGHGTASGFGLESRSSCEGIIEGFSMGNVTDYGIAMTLSAPCQGSTIVDQHRVAHNYIGVDPGGIVAAPNVRGLLIDNAAGAEISDNVISGNFLSGLWSWRSSVGVYRNLIGTAADGKTPLPNGRSGILIGPLVQEAEVFGNTISFNAEMGVAVARGAQLVDIRQNSMRDNGGLGIDIGLDGPNAPVADDHLTQGNAPTLLSAVYDPVTKTTAITLTLSTTATALYGNAAYVVLYSNDKPDGDGEKWITEFLVNANGETSTLKFPADLRGKWINGTAMRVHFLAAKPPSPEFFAGGDATTSEFGNAVLAH